SLLQFRPHREASASPDLLRHHFYDRTYKLANVQFSRPDELNGFTMYIGVADRGAQRPFLHSQCIGHSKHDCCGIHRNNFYVSGWPDHLKHLIEHNFYTGTIKGQAAPTPSVASETTFSRDSSVGSTMRSAYPASLATCRHAADTSERITLRPLAFSATASGSNTAPSCSAISPKGCSQRFFNHDGLGHNTAPAGNTDETHLLTQSCI